MENEKIKDYELRDMELHEILPVNDGIEVMRVPNGWVYSYYVPNNLGEFSCSLAFVPESLP